MVNISLLSLLIRVRDAPDEVARCSGDALRLAGRIVHLVRGDALVRAAVDSGWMTRTLDSWTWLPAFLRDDIAAWIITFWLAILLVRIPFFIRGLSGRSSPKKYAFFTLENINGFFEITAKILFFTGFLLTVNTKHVMTGVIFLALAGLSALAMVGRSLAFPGRCPECHRRVRRDAIRCKHCGSSISKGDTAQARRSRSHP